MTSPNLEEQLRDEGISAAIIKFLGMLTSYEMRTAHLQPSSQQGDEQSYADYVWTLMRDGADARNGEKVRHLTDYCHERVELEAWADHIEIGALSKCPKTETEIVNIGSKGVAHRTPHNETPPGSRSPRASLLLRELHYEVLCSSRRCW